MGRNKVKVTIKAVKRGLRIPKWAFVPDNWSKVFLTALLKLAQEWEGKIVWEVGVGTGANPRFLRKVVSGIRWVISDYKQKAVPLALHNLRDDFTNVVPLLGQWDLLQKPADYEGNVPKPDVVFACVPQVPEGRKVVESGDGHAHYYDPTRYPDATNLNEFGLVLVGTLLDQAKDRGIPEVVLNLAGRPGKERLLQLFQVYQYDPEIVHVVTVSQHRGTKLTSFARLEKKGYSDFEFFKDAECRKPVSARVAERRRKAGKSVYHKIYVVRGRLTA